jgi:hypothetical protein
MKPLRPTFLLLVLCLCLGGTALPAQKPPGFLLNLYHFNIQYVVGHEASMRRIVVESFEPLVDFYLDHPGWGASFEMQGAMIEYMAGNYPAVLEKFKRLVNSGQCELITFHLSDALLLAYPDHDQEWSLKLNDALLEKYGVKRSGVIFAQEEQFGEGYARPGLPRGYKIAIMSPGQYDWFQDDDRFPFYTVNGLIVIPNSGATEAATGIRVRWQFLGDGELVVTGGFSPYFVGLFRKNPARLKLLEQQFQAAINEGYKPVTVTAYVDALLAACVQPQPLKPILDSPWRPGDGSGVFQWMGRYSLPWERDYDIRTQAWRTRSLLIEAERAGADPAVLAEAWYHLLMVEVSDPTGWYPLPVEVRFAYDEMDAVHAALAKDKSLDLAALERKAAAGPACGAAAIAPLALVTRGKAEDATIKWSTLEGRPDSYCLSVGWSGEGDGAVAFPWTAETVEYSPAMMEDLPLRVIPVKELKGNVIHLALPNGLIGLGNGMYLVRDNNAGIVAARVDFPARQIAFEVQKGREKSYSFRFYLLKSSVEEAHKFANEVNRVEP